MSNAKKNDKFWRLLIGSACAGLSSLLLSVPASAVTMAPPKMVWQIAANGTLELDGDTWTGRYLITGIGNAGPDINSSPAVFGYNLDSLSISIPGTSATAQWPGASYAFYTVGSTVGFVELYPPQPPGIFLISQGTSSALLGYDGTTSFSPTSLTWTTGGPTAGTYRYSLDTSLGKVIIGGPFDYGAPTGLRFRAFELAEPSTETTPLLPGAVNPATGAMTFDFIAFENNTVWIDPIVTSGYNYRVNLGGNMLSAIFPQLGDPDGYEVYNLNSDGSLGSLLGISTSSTPFSFGPGGVSAFALRDIETSLMLDPANQTAFVTGLTFDVAGSGAISMTQTPVTTFVPDSAVPEPSVWAMMMAGFAGIAASLRGQRKRRRKNLGHSCA